MRLAVAPDGKTLFVANADNNNVAVIDIATPSRSQVKGFIPTGWYPTAVAVTPDGKQLLIGVGKGLQTKPNPIKTAKAEGSDRTRHKRGLSRISARRSRDRFRSCRYPTTRHWPLTPRRSTRTAPIPTSC